MFTDTVFTCSIIMLVGLSLAVTIPFLLYLEIERSKHDKEDSGSVLWLWVSENYETVR